MSKLNRRALIAGAAPIRQPYIEAIKATTRVTPICKSALRTATRQPWAMELRTWFARMLVGITVSQQKRCLQSR